MPDDDDSICIDVQLRGVVGDQLDGSPGIVEGLGPATASSEAAHTAIIDVEQPPAPSSHVTREQPHHPPVVGPTPRSAMEEHDRWCRWAAFFPPLWGSVHTDLMPA